MKPFGTPYSDHALRVLLLGSGELGKEVAIELQRYAVEVIAGLPQLRTDPPDFFVDGIGFSVMTQDTLPIRLYRIGQ